MELKFTKEQTAALIHAKQVIDLLCEEMEREAPLHNVQAFLHIAAASAQGKTVEVKELQEATGLPSSTMSRAMGALGEWSYKDRPGLQLITTKADYSDRRRKPTVLSPKGEKLAGRVAAIIM